MVEAASGDVVRELITVLEEVVRGVLGGGVPRLVESGFLSSLPGARAQSFHADTAPAHLRCVQQLASRKLSLLRRPPSPVARHVVSRASP